ncbi:histidinol-phosphate transaminase [candidate division KSB1 bacterium]
MSKYMGKIKQSILDKKPYSFNEIQAEIKLNQNESPYDIPNEIKKKVCDLVLLKKWNRYPSISGEPLREALSKYLDIPESKIAVGVGSDEMLNSVASIILSKDKKLLIVEPTFQMYEQCGIALDADIVRINLNEDFSYPVEKIIDTIREQNIDLFMFASPNSPTGKSMAVSDIERILECSDCIVVVDEAYYEFSGKTALPLLEEHKNLIITRTLSKAFSMAGLRAGYLIADEKLVENIFKVKMPFSLNIFTEAAAVAILEDPIIIKKNVEKILNSKRSLFQFLNTIKGMEILDSDTNFFVIRIPEIGKRAIDILRENGIAARDISHYPMLDDCIRINVGTPEENEIVVNALISIVEK